MIETNDVIASADIEALIEGRHRDPFSVLGYQGQPGGGGRVTAFIPGATHVAAISKPGQILLAELTQVHAAGLFSGTVSSEDYLLRCHWPSGLTTDQEDPYRFATLLGELDVHLLAEGQHRELGYCLGAQPMAIEGVAGTRFALWAPNASRVSVVGDFNHWDGRRHPMRLRHAAGVWELFLPGVGPGKRYKFELLDRHGRLLPQKADPVARATEPPPSTASVVAAPGRYPFSDHDWLSSRAQTQAEKRPLLIYEVHVGSWLRAVNDPKRGWDILAEKLIPYAVDLGFTHVELLPIMEHPFGGSWGYQPLSQFAPTARFGTPEAFAAFVDRCHAQGLGVILDWVPAHFPTDEHGLARFDGTALYEYLDPREGFHGDWNTFIYNLGRNEVRGFLIASALYWLEAFHVDGLRVDAVASMLYRDYSRPPGEWLPNRFGGRENLEAIDFLRELNRVVAERAPGAITIAEESTAWPGVTASPKDGGLGFCFKWNMGWMHDTLRYIEHEPVHRRWHHHDLTFGLVYAHSERFVLPISHDEVVYGKRSLLGKMPGDDWQRFANLRAYLCFMWTQPGKKLLFMGSELGQPTEWDHDGEIEWALTAAPRHAGIQRLVDDLNDLVRKHPALYAEDSQASGFRWIVGDDAAQSVLAYVRHATLDNDAEENLVVALNFTPMPRHNYRVGVPTAGRWREILNSDAAVYAGSNLGNAGLLVSEAVPAHGYAHSVSALLPPLAGVVFAFEA